MEYFKKNFLTVEGRINRWKYFKFMFLIGLIESLVNFFVGFSFLNLTSTGDKLSTLVELLFIIPTYFLMTQRLHDIGKDDSLAKVCAAIFVYFAIFVDIDTDLSGVDSIAAFVSLIIGLYLLFKKGTSGYNQYGADPLQ